jgi:phosphoribosylaminoimidazole (AIR) synthetase
MIAVVGRGDVESVRQAAEGAGVKSWVIGEIVSGKTGVKFTER